MKLGCIIPVLDEWRFMPAVTNQLLKVVDRCLVLQSTMSFTSRPVELVNHVPLDPRVEVEIGNWGNEAATRNTGLDKLKDCDYIIIADTDEILLDNALQKLVGLAQEGKHLAYAASLLTYWKTPCYRIEPPEPLGSPCSCVMVRYDVRFKDVRWPGIALQPTDVKIHHLSYVRTNEELKAKLSNFSHAAEIKPGWYDRVWLGWDSNKEMIDIHPTHPWAYKKAIFEENQELLTILGDSWKGEK